MPLELIQIPGAGSIPTSQKGAANGIATLDGSSKLTASQLPALRLVSVSSVANQAARLALPSDDDAQFVVQNDTAVTYMLAGGADPSVNGNWLALPQPSTAGLAQTSQLHGAIPPALALASGTYIFPLSQSATNTSNTLTSGTLRASPAYLPAMTVTRIGAEVTAAGSAGCTLRLGIYNDNGSGLPGTLLLDAGTIAGDSATVQEITLGSSLVIPAGFYWMAMALQGAPASQPTVRIGGTAPVALPVGAGTSIPGASASVASYTMTGVTGALPSPFVIASASATIPRLFFKLQ